MLFVTEDNPRLLDEQFASCYPALELRTTSNSGAFHGDGDLRGQAVRYDRPTFALESKARFSSRYRSCMPAAEEWEKAMTQLRKFDRQAIRLFLVYHAGLRSWAVSLPCEDAWQLAELLGTDEMPGQVKHVRRRGVSLPLFHLRPAEWDELYALIEHTFCDDQLES